MKGNIKNKLNKEIKLLTKMLEKSLHVRDVNSGDPAALAVTFLRYDFYNQYYVYFQISSGYVQSIGGYGGPDRWSIDVPDPHNLKENYIVNINMMNNNKVFFNADIPWKGWAHESKAKPTPPVGWHPAIKGSARHKFIEIANSPGQHTAYPNDWHSVVVCAIFKSFAPVTLSVDVSQKKTNSHPAGKSNKIIVPLYK
jgi:hypothetical protein